MNLSNKVVIITGASSGIGKELAFQFARKGCSVVLAARHESLIQAHADAIANEGHRVLAVRTDVGDRAQVENLIRRTIETFGRVDILINNAGISPAKGIVLENTEQDVRDTMNVNFMGGLYGLWAVAPQMEKQGGGMVVFVTSVIGKRGIPKNSAYCASKFATQGLAESIRPELKPKNIHILTICPPGVDTPFYQNNGKSNEQRYRLHPADLIARRIVSAVEREKREDLLTTDGRLLHILNFFFPKFLDWAIGRVKGVSK